jgi:hypothetical protein
MNMISTGAFQNEMDASRKQQELIKKLTAAWEKKNSKVGRAGGVSLMALSLAACGGDDDTPFSQVDVDAAVAASEAAIIGDINDTYGTAFTVNDETSVIFAAVAASDNGPLELQIASALVAQQTAETAAASALVGQAAAEAQAAGALVAQAASVAELAAANAAKETAEAAQAASAVQLTAANAAKATAEASLATLQTSYDALVAPKALTLTTSTTADALVGGVGNDTFTGAVGTLAATDSIRDNSTTDNDTLTITDEDGTIGAFTVQNVENVNLNINALAANVSIDAANYTGVNNLTITRADLSVGGSTLTGSKTIDVVNVNGEQVTTITTAGTATVVNITQQDAAGVTLNMDNASGSFTVTGAATVNAAGAGTGDTVTVNAFTLAEAGGTAAGEAAQNAKAVTVNTGAASVITAVGGGNHLDGAITITAAAAGVVTIPSALGGATVSALGASATGVDIREIDASGATVTTTLNQAATAAAQIIDLGAVATANVTATATVSALGNVALNTGVASDGIDTITLSGNGGAVNYTVTTGNGNTETFNVTGDVTLSGNESVFDGEAITGNAAAIMLAAASTGGAAIDAEDWTATKIGVAFDQNSTAAITAASGQNYEFTTNQTGIDFDFGASVTAQSLTITAGDQNTVADTTVGTLTMGAMNVTSGTATSGTIAFVANEANLTATGLTAAALQDITISGDEDVNLGTVVTANSINATNSTGILTVTAGASAKSVTGGSGADQLTLNGGRIHTLDGGAGNDTITVTSTNATSTINGGAGNDGITITDVDQYVVIGGAGTDNFNVGANVATTIVGGDGSDTLTITTGGVDFAAGFAVAGVEKLNVTATNGTTDFTAAEFAGLASSEITGNTATDVIQITAAASGSTLDMSGLTAASGSTQAITTVMGAGNDIITGSVLTETFAFNGVSGWKGTDSISGGATGTDTITSDDTTIQEVGTSGTSSGIVLNMGTTAVSNVSILSNAAGHLGGTATSVAAGSVAYIYAAADTSGVNSTVTDSVSGIENFTSTDGAGVEYVVGNSSSNVISVGAGADFVSGGAGADTITGGAGVDILQGGDGNDSFVYGATAELVAGTAVVDSVAGGNGTGDAITINNNGGATVTVASTHNLERITGVETINVSGATNKIVSLTLHADAHIDGFRTVDLSADTDATSANVIDASNVTTGGLTLTGSAGVDTITGSAQADTLTGGAGADFLNGGNGADTIVLSTATDSTSAAADTTITHDVINTFVVADDSIKVAIGADIVAASDIDVTGTFTGAGSDSVAATLGKVTTVFNTLFDGTVFAALVADSGTASTAYATASGVTVGGFIGVDADKDGNWDDSVDIILTVGTLTGTLSAADFIA